MSNRMHMSSWLCYESYWTHIGRNITVRIIIVKMIAILILVIVIVIV